MRSMYYGAGKPANQDDSTENEILYTPEAEVARWTDDRL
jgi:hypothetical protein